MAQEKSGGVESRSSNGYPKAADKESHRGHEPYEGQDGKRTQREKHADEGKRQAGDGRVHYKGPSRQLGGYELPDAETGEPRNASSADRGGTSTHSETTGSRRK